MLIKLIENYIIFYSSQEIAIVTSQFPTSLIRKASSSSANFLSTLQITLLKIYKLLQVNGFPYRDG